ncbi:hypothetical protein EV121DRAFT_194997 [Schizophyllum commune]
MPDVPDLGTAWEKRFMQLVRTHVRRDPPELDYHILRLPIVREAHARLDARKIPRLPLRPADTLPVHEALEAFMVYWQVLEAANACGGATATLGLAPFDSIWRWIKFLLPSSGNMRDDGRRDHPRPKYVDGHLSCALVPLEYILRRHLASALMYEEGRNRCLAQPDFTNVFLDVYCSYHSGVRTIIDAQVSHTMIQALSQLLDNPSTSPRLLAEIRAYDAQHPAKFLHTMLDTMLSFFDHSFDHSLVPPYLSLISTLLAFDDMSHNSVAHGGVQKLCGILMKTVAYPVGEEIAPSLTITTHCVSQLIRLASQYPSAVEDILNVRILAYVISAVFDKNDCKRPVGWRVPPAELIRDLLSSCLVWPCHITMLTREVRKLRILRCLGDDPPVLPELNLFVYQLSLREKARKELKAILSGPKRCHNEGLCPGGGAETIGCKMCRCGRAFYCSRECQKMHWRMAHREACGTADERRYMKDENPRLSLQPFERCLLKKLAWDFAEEANLHRSYETVIGNAVLIRFHVGPELGASAMEDPLSLTDPPRVYAQVRRGSEESTVLMGSLGAAFW